MKRVIFFLLTSGILTLLFSNASIAPSVPTSMEHRCWAPGESILPYRKEITFPLSSEIRRKIFVSPTASSVTREAAADLARVLQEMLGLSFPIAESATPNVIGIYLGTFEDHPLPQLDPRAEVESEAYAVKSTVSTLFLIGSTDRGVPHAMWDALHRLGYRRYFPGNHWRIVPKLTDAAIAANFVCRPAFEMRQFFYGFTGFDESYPLFSEWQKENRMGGEIIKVGHAYDKIIANNEAFFTANPHLLGRHPDGSISKKLCVTHPDVQNIVIKYAQQQTTQAVSMEPSDGGGWEGCNEDTNLIRSPTVTNRAVFLANLAAKTLNTDPENPRLVTMYAYNEHSPPPTTSLHKNLIVFIATWFLRFEDGEQSDLVEGWRRMGLAPGGTRLGVRDYWSYTWWDRDLPGQTAAADISKLQKKLAFYKEKNGRYYVTEGSNNWGPNGLAYWTAANLLWTPRQVPENYLKDFVQNAFGNASGPMTEFYELLHFGPRPLSTTGYYQDDLVLPGFIQKLYSLLNEAILTRPTGAELRRIRELALYLHYVELFQKYESTVNDWSARQVAYEKLMEYAFSIRNLGMVYTAGIWRDIPVRDKSLRRPAGTEYSLKAEDLAANPWYQVPLLTWSSSKVDEILKNGARLPSYNIESKYSSANLLPVTQAPSIPSATGWRMMEFRSKQLLRYLATPGENTLRLRLNGGSNDYGFGKLRLKFCPRSVPTACQYLKILADGKTREVFFSVPAAGPYELTVEDHSHGVRVEWPAGTKISVVASYEDRPNLHQRWKHYIFVPKDTANFRIFSDKPISVCSKSYDQCVQTPKAPSGLIEIDVPVEDRGKFWAIQGFGSIVLFDIPPVIAASPDEILLPAGVL